MISCDLNGNLTHLRGILTVNVRVCRYAQGADLAVAKICRPS
jgi:hypothetical protein